MIFIPYRYPSMFRSHRGDPLKSLRTFSEVLHDTTGAYLTLSVGILFLNHGAHIAR